MSSASASAFPAVRWDLSALFSSPKDPKIEASWAEAHQRADAFVALVRPQLEAGISGAQLLAALREYEAISELAIKPQSYAGLLFATDSASAAIGAFYGEQSERASELAVKLVFFTLQLQDLPDEHVARCLSEESGLEAYRHYLEVTRKGRPHKLTEVEEVLLEEVSNVGTRAWVRLHEELFANHVFKVATAEGVQELTESETLALLRSSDRAVRQAAADGLSAGLAELERTVCFIFNTLLLDKKIEDKLRKHPFPEHSRHLSNELEKETVDLVVDMCRDRQDLVARFYRVKQEILGLPELTHIDRYAPLMEAESEVSFEEGKEIVLGAMGRFSSELRDSAAEFFDKGWIDAEPRAGKQGGAFCSSVVPSLHPVVFMNYQNKMDDVMTLAHELGHAVHGSLSRGQSLLNFYPTLPMAELASTFAEMLVFESLVEKASDEEKLALYAEKIEGVFATVFRQAAMFRFERRAHEARREGELSPSDYGDIWQEEIQSMFGDSVKIGDQHRSWWMYVIHFVAMPFYVYAYSFGELVVLSLYEKGKLEGPSFAGKYAQVLSLGGARSPQELMDIVDVDLQSETFWRGGFEVLERMIEAFEALWAAQKR